MEHLRRLLAPICHEHVSQKSAAFSFDLISLLAKFRFICPDFWVVTIGLSMKAQDLSDRTAQGKNFQREKVALFWETGFQHLRTQFSSSSKYDHSGQSHLNIKYQSKLPELFNSISNLEMIAFNYPLRSSPSSIRSWQRL